MVLLTAYTESNSFFRMWKWLLCQSNRPTQISVNILVNTGGERTHISSRKMHTRVAATSVLRLVQLFSQSLATPREIM